MERGRVEFASVEMRTCWEGLEEVMGGRSRLMVWTLRYVTFVRRWGGGGGGIEDLCVCFGEGTLSSCCLFGYFSGGLNDGCRRVFKRSFQCCVSSA